MVDIKFKGKIKKIGNSFMVVVPMIWAKLLNKNKEYYFIIINKKQKGGL